MCKKKESQGPKSYINTHALRQAITPTDTYAYKHIDVHFGSQCMLAYYHLVHTCTHNSHTYVQSLAPLYMLSDTYTNVHVYTHTYIPLHNWVTQPHNPRHMHSHRSFLLQRPPGWESGPPSPEVNEVRKSAGHCLSGWY